MSLSLTVLGCHSATPRSEAYPSAQYLEVKNTGYLIDCGEGTQMLLRRYKIKFSRLRYVFISHLHGDHFFGLIGMISSFGLLGRTQPLTIFGPKGIKEIITLQLRLSKSWVNFELYFHELTGKDKELIHSDDQVEVFSLPLKHRIYVNGYLFVEKPGPRKIDIEAVAAYKEIERCDYQNLKNGKDFQLSSGEIIPNTRLTKDPPKPGSYAYCSDTAYLESLPDMIKGADLLYHESTFLERHRDLAESTLHSTAKDAAQIAADAQVGQLLLGHFSSRYSDESEFLSEASSLFERVLLAESGMQLSIPNT